MVGFPHSEIPGSKLIRSSPRLIAAYYVLHRLHAPRHPLDALKTLDRSHYRCPLPNRPLLKANVSVVGIVKCQRHHDAGCLIGQIKLTRIHVLSLFLPGVRVKRDKEASLYDVERSGRGAFAGTTQPNLSLIIATYVSAVRRCLTR